MPLEDKLYATVKELEEKVEETLGKKDKIYQSDKGSDNKTVNKIEDKKQKVLYKAAKSVKGWDNAVGDFARNYTDMVDANTKGLINIFMQRQILKQLNVGWVAK